MKEIRLGESGLTALVDDEDYDDLIQFAWFVKQPSPRNRTMYAYRFITHNHRELMHKRITGNDKTDHKDGNGLNNCRSNLRTATDSQNKANMPKLLGTYSSQYKGVTWDRSRGMWKAATMVDKKYKFIGRYKDEHTAAVAYDRAAIDYFGEYAHTNFPKENYNVT